MSETTQLVLQRRQLAAGLRDARTRAGKTIEDVATHLMCSAAKISRMETGKRSVNPRDVRDLCAYYGLDDGERERLMGLAQESRRQAWWETHKLSPSYSTYIGLEAAADSIVDYKSSIVPGFLQTQEYAIALITSYFSPPDPVVVSRLTQTRMARQTALFDRADPPSAHVIMDEAVLHRAVGGREVMAAQLDRLIEAVETLDLTLQIVPFSLGGHAGVECTFTILSFDEPSLPTAAFAEDVFGLLQLERPGDLGVCQQVFARVAAVALSQAESLELIKTLRHDKYGPVESG